MLSGEYHSQQSGVNLSGEGGREQGVGEPHKLVNGENPVEAPVDPRAIPLTVGLSPTANGLWFLRQRPHKTGVLDPSEQIELKSPL